MHIYGVRKTNRTVLFKYLGKVYDGHGRINYVLTEFIPAEGDKLTQVVLGTVPAYQKPPEEDPAEA